jgi:hypothetical protein
VPAVLCALLAACGAERAQTSPSAPVTVSHQRPPPRRPEHAQRHQRRPTCLGRRPPPSRRSAAYPEVTAFLIDDEREGDPPGWKFRAAADGLVLRTVDDLLSGGGPTVSTAGAWQCASGGDLAVLCPGDGALVLVDMRLITATLVAEPAPRPDIFDFNITQDGTLVYLDGGLAAAVLVDEAWTTAASVLAAAVPGYAAVVSADAADPGGVDVLACVGADGHERWRRPDVEFQSARRSPSAVTGMSWWRDRANPPRIGTPGLGARAWSVMQSATDTPCGRSPNARTSQSSAAAWRWSPARPRARPRRMTR